MMWFYVFLFVIYIISLTQFPSDCFSIARLDINLTKFVKTFANAINPIRNSLFKVQNRMRFTELSTESVSLRQLLQLLL